MAQKIGITPGCAQKPLLDQCSGLTPGRTRSPKVPRGKGRDFEGSGESRRSRKEKTPISMCRKSQRESPRPPTPSQETEVMVQGEECEGKAEDDVSVCGGPGQVRSARVLPREVAKWVTGPGMWLSEWKRQLGGPDLDPASLEGRKEEEGGRAWE